MRRLHRIGTLLAVGGLVLLPAKPARAHPMGNFSISHYAALRPTPGGIELRYLIDMAEIPTFQEIQDTGIKPIAGEPALASYLESKGQTVAKGLLLEADGKPLALLLAEKDVIFPPGAGGLPTMKLRFVYRASLASRAGQPIAFHYRDDNFPGRAGWKEIVADGGRGIVLLASSAPKTDRSHELSNYPTDLINSPPQDLEARVSYRVLPGAIADSSAAFSASPALIANAQGTPRNAFTELMGTRTLSLWFVMVAAIVAAGLGGLHALEPGHGKTIVAAYLVGSRGTAWHAFLLGLIVTLSHTAGVYLLGIATLSASQYVVPDRLYPWLSALSGLVIAGVGGYMLRLRLGTRAAHAHPHSHTHVGAEHVHSHGHSHLHDHEHAHPHDHDHPHSHEHGHSHDDAISMRQLTALGITGGIIPCPAALVVLLGAVSMHRIGFGLFLIVAFSVGLAAVLIAVGMLTVYALRFTASLKMDGPLIQRWLPVTSAAVITLFGVAIVARTLLAGWRI